MQNACLQYITLLQIGGSDATVQLLKGGQTSSAHPNNELLIVYTRQLVGAIDGNIREASTESDA